MSVLCLRKPVLVAALLCPQLIAAMAPAPAAPADLSGTVRDAATSPVDGFTARLSNATTGAFVTQASADESGAFSLSAAVATYRLTIERCCGDNFTIYNDVTLSADRSVTLTVPWRTVTVHVQTPGGDPIPGTTVEPGSPSAPPITLGDDLIQSACCTNYSSAHSQTTGSGGDATFRLLPNASSKTITIYPPGDSGYVTSTATLAPTATSTAVTATAVPGVVLSGVVRDTEASPLAGIIARLSTPSTGAFVAQANADSGTGGFSLSALPGTYRLTIERCCGENFTIYNDVTLSANRSVTLTAPLRTVTVQVQTPSGDPVPDAIVEPGAPFAPPIALGDDLTQSACCTNYSTANSRTTDAGGGVSFRLLPNSAFRTVLVHRLTDGGYVHSTATLPPTSTDTTVTAVTAT